MGNWFSDTLKDVIHGIGELLPEKDSPAAPSGNNDGGEESGGGSEANNTANQGLSAAQGYYDKMAALAEEQAARSRELWNIYKTSYLPGELAWAKQTFAGIPVQQEVNWATNDVNTAYDKAGRVQARNMQSMGINPSSPAYQANAADVAQARAAAEAGARTTARRKVNDVNWNRRESAVVQGRNLMSPSISMAGQAGSMYTAGNAGLQNAFNAKMNLENTQDQRAWTSGENAVNREFTAGENQKNRDYQQELANQQAEAQLWGGLLNLGGMAVGAAVGGPIGAAVGGYLTKSFNPGTSLSTSTTSYQPYGQETGKINDGTFSWDDAGYNSGR